MDPKNGGWFQVAASCICAFEFIILWKYDINSYHICCLMSSLGMMRGKFLLFIKRSAISGLLPSYQELACTHLHLRKRVVFLICINLYQFCNIVVHKKNRLNNESECFYVRVQRNLNLSEPHGNLIRVHYILLHG